MSFGFFCLILVIKSISHSARLIVVSNILILCFYLILVPTLDAISKLLIEIATDKFFDLLY